MSESKVEQVARAIYEGRNGKGCTAWGRMPRSHRDPYLVDARCAIEAMREPTEAMVDAGRQALRDAGLLPAYTDAGGSGQPPLMAHMLRTAAWPAMITAALEDR